jgi:hypothetical protein
MEDGSQIDVDHCVELIERHLLQTRVARNACVIHQHVDAAEAPDHARDHLVHTEPVGHVDAVSRCFRTCFPARLGHFLERRLIDVAHNDRGTFLRELASGGRADALPRARDQRYFFF